MERFYGRAGKAVSVVNSRPGWKTEHPRNTGVAPAGDRREIETDFAELGNGTRVETIEDPTDPSKTILAIYENGNVRLDERFESGGRVLIPIPRNGGIFDCVRLPKGVAHYESIRSLVTDTNALLCACLDINPALLPLVSFFVLSTWFSEKLPVAPYLALVGMPRSGKSTLLRLLQLLCRHSILVADISVAAFYQAHESTVPTLLIDETGTVAEQKKLLHILRTGSTPGFLALRKNAYFNCYGPKAFAWGELPSDYGFNTRCIVIPMHETDRTDLMRPTDPRVLSAAEALQKQFLQLRLEKFDVATRGEASGIDGMGGLHSRDRDLYQALAYAISGDKELCQMLRFLIRTQEQFTREPISVGHAGVLTALLSAVHSPEASTISITEVARCANQCLADQGESFQLSAHAAGRILTSFGIVNRKRRNSGWWLELTQKERRTIHLLLARYGADRTIVPVSFGPSTTCVFCKELLSAKEGGYVTGVESSGTPEM